MSILGIFRKFWEHIPLTASMESFLNCLISKKDIEIFIDSAGKSGDGGPSFLRIAYKDL